MGAALQTVGHFIGGEEVFEGDLSERRDPADIDVIVAKTHQGSPELMDAAVEAAGEAFDAWAEVPGPVRGQVLLNAANLLATPEWTDKFANAMVAEIGKTEGGAKGEVAKTYKILTYMAGLPTHTREEVYSGHQPDVHMYSQSEPVGVAGLITPFNFPLAVTVWKLAAALAAGCTAAIKPSPHAPMTSKLIMELFKEAFEVVPALKKAGIGPGVINMVHGGPEVASAMIRNLLVQALSFTGSTPVGMSVLQQAITRPGGPIDPGNLLGEMGGDNAILVLADADIDMALSAAVGGSCIGEGQRCTATSRVLVDHKIAAEFERMFVERLATLKVGPGSDPGTDVGPLVTPESRDAVLDAIAQSQTNGMRLLHGGTASLDPAHARGNYVMPTLLKGDPFDATHLALRQEIFGPVVGLGEIDGFEEGIRAVNDNTHAHVASVFTENIGLLHQFARRARAGMVHGRNTTLGGDELAPFGGLGGDTSYGPQEMGPRAMEPFQKRKTVGINYGNAVLGGRDR